MAEGGDFDESSEEDGLFLDYLNDVLVFPAGKTFQERSEPFELYDDRKFRARFRLRKPTVLLLLSEIEEQLEYVTDRNRSVSPINQLLLALRFYATGTFQLVLGDVFGVDKSTACRIVHKVTRAIAALASKFIKFPSTEQERRNVMHEFYGKSGLPGVLGAIDCTHVPIQSPGGDQAEEFRNRKGYFSINVQLVCDYNLYVTDIVARWAGSVHDSTIFDFSHLRAKFETGEIPEGCLVGDSGYACRPYMLTPLGNPTTQAERRYNAAQISARNPIERANGVIKRRFPALKYGMRLKLENVLPVIVAATVCHNIAVSVGEDDPPVDAELAEFVNRRRERGLQVDFENVDVPDLPQPAHAGATAQRAALINGYFANV